MQALKKYYKVIALPLFQDNYSYIISGTANKSLVLVDPANPTVVMNYVKNNFPQYLISHVLYTHKHWDHAGGSQQLSQQLKSLNPEVKLMIGQNDRQHVQGTNYSVSSGQKLTIGNSIVKTVHVPCHTRGHTIFNFLPIQKSFNEQHPQIAQTTLQGKRVRQFNSHSCTFTGDTLFIGGIGRFFQGNAAQMSQNIQNIYQTIDLDSDIFCGHEYAIQNLSWGMMVENNNKAIKDYHSQLIKQRDEQGEACSIPSTLRKQRQINVFVRAVTGSPLHNQVQKNPAQLMRILREMKNKNHTNYNQFKSSQL